MGFSCVGVELTPGLNFLQVGNLDPGVESRQS